MRPDPVRLEVFHHLFAAVAEEMGAALLRASFSPNIKERRDFSCALFDGAGRMIAQAAHLPVHLGSAPLSVRAVIERYGDELRPGDAVLLNDPYRGGTHLPDLTLVAPVFLGGERERAETTGGERERAESTAAERERAESTGGERERAESTAAARERAESTAGACHPPDFFVLNRAHHADVGGGSPGSMAPAADVHAEGLRIPPVLLARGGELSRDVLDLFLANVRGPREREGDLFAQWSANKVGARRLADLAREHGRAELAARASELLDWTERLTAAALSELPAGTFSFEDELETVCPATGRNARVCVDLELAGGRCTFDFSRTDSALPNGANAPRAVTLSAVFYVLRLLLPPGTPTNDGVLRRARVVTRPGTIADARYPSAVAAGNVETSQRLVDVLLGALSRAAPGRFPAASSGTMSNLVFGGPLGDDGSYAYYETLAGGAGGGPEGRGAHAVHTHMTNTRNTPIEAFEVELPVRVARLGLRPRSGGAGRAAGGDGLSKELVFLRPARVGWIAERQRSGPWGLAGGCAGSPGGAWIRRAGWRAGRRAERVTGSSTHELAAGDSFLLHTPGGGGFGRPRPRERR